MASRFAYDRSGSIMVCATGGELYAYAGDDERPLWNRALGAEVAAVGTTAGEVMALAGDRLHRFEAAAGAPLATVELGAGALGMAVARDGTVAVLVGGAVQLVTGGRTAAKLAAPGATHVAISDDGAEIAVGFGDGKLQLFARDGSPTAQVALAGPVRGLAHSVLGGWVVAAGDQVVKLDARLKGKSELLRAPDAGLLSISADGGLLALSTRARAVEVYTLPSPSRVARVEYADRPVDGVAFGPDVWLGVGLGSGDANKINLVTGACHRTDPPAGKTRTAWQLQLDVDKDRVKEGRSTANPSAEAVKQKLADKARPSLVDSPPSRAILWIAIALALVMVGVAFWLKR